MAVEWPTIPFEKLLNEPVRNGIYKRKEFHGRGVTMVNMGELFAYSRLLAECLPLSTPPYRVPALRHLALFHKVVSSLDELIQF